MGLIPNPLDSLVKKKDAEAKELQNIALQPLVSFYTSTFYKIYNASYAQLKFKQQAVKSFSRACDSLISKMETVQNQFKECLDDLEAIRQSSRNLTTTDIVSEVIENMPYLRRAMSEPVFWVAYEDLKLVEDNVGDAVGNIGDWAKQLIKKAILNLISQLDGYYLMDEYFAYVTQLTSALYLKFIDLSFLPSNIMPQVTNKYSWAIEGVTYSDGIAIEEVPDFDKFQGITIPVMNSTVSLSDFTSNFNLKDPSTYWMLTPESREQCTKAYKWWTSNFRTANNALMNSDTYFGERNKASKYALIVGKPTNHKLENTPLYPAMDQWGNLLGFAAWSQFDQDKAPSDTQGFYTFTLNSNNVERLAIVTPGYNYIYDTDGNFEKKIPNYIPKSNPKATEWSVVDIIYEMYAMVSDLEGIAELYPDMEAKLSDLMSLFGFEISTQQAELVEESESNGKNAKVVCTLITDYSNKIKAVLDEIYETKNQITSALESW